jgi:hypothetical protein
MSNIAIVIPTIRPESMKTFMAAWKPLFEKHRVVLITVHDGTVPTVHAIHYDIDASGRGLNQMTPPMTAIEVMGDAAESLTNFNAGIRNLGFAYAAKYLPNIEYFITLDDDEDPIGDTIQDHLDALSMRVPVSWMSTASEYMRGFPYAVRSEAEVVLSHGVWEGVADWDAPTQLVLGGTRPVTFYRGPIPKGIYYPMCIMNIAFKRKMLPTIFQAPWALGMHRFDDIWSGIVSKREIDAQGWAAVTGYARVYHQRASNVFTSLQHEAPGIAVNETFWQGDESHPYFAIYRDKLRIWQDFLATCPI